MKGRARPAGVVIGGDNLIAVDVVATYLMGFDPAKLKYLQALLEPYSYDLSLQSLDQIKVVSNVEAYKRLVRLDRADTLCFEPPLRWKGQMELDDKSLGAEPVRRILTPRETG